jgi:hypothetical protein
LGAIEATDQLGGMGLVPSIQTSSVWGGQAAQHRSSGSAGSTTSQIDPPVSQTTLG